MLLTILFFDFSGTKFYNFFHFYIYFQKFIYFFKFIISHFFLIIQETETPIYFLCSYVLVSSKSGNETFELNFLENPLGFLSLFLCLFLFFFFFSCFHFFIMFWFLQMFSGVSIVDCICLLYFFLTACQVLRFCIVVLWVLQIWESVFYSQVFFTLTPSCFYQGFPGAGSSALKMAGLRNIDPAYLFVWVTQGSETI